MSVAEITGSVLHLGSNYGCLSSFVFEGTRMFTMDVIVFYKSIDTVSDADASWSWTAACTE